MSLAWHSSCGRYSSHLIQSVKFHPSQKELWNQQWNQKVSWCRHGEWARDVIEISMELKKSDWVMVEKGLRRLDYFCFYISHANLIIQDQNLSKVQGKEVRNYLWKKDGSSSGTQKAIQFAEEEILTVVYRDITNFLEEQPRNWLGRVGVVRLGFSYCLETKIVYTSRKRT